MNNKVNHWCKICGTGYYACDDCDKLGNWRAVACSPDHAQIYNALIFYTRGYSTKSETAAFLKSLGLTKQEIQSFSPSITNLIQEIMCVEKNKNFKKRG